MSQKVPSANVEECSINFGIPEVVSSSNYTFVDKCDNPNTKKIPVIPKNQPQALAECLKTAYQVQQTGCINSCLQRSFQKAMFDWTEAKTKKEIESNNKWQSFYNKYVNKNIWDNTDICYGWKDAHGTYRGGDPFDDRFPNLTCFSGGRCQKDSWPQTANWTEKPKFDSNKRINGQSCNEATFKQEYLQQINDIKPTQITPRSMPNLMCQNCEIDFKNIGTINSDNIRLKNNCAQDNKKNTSKDNNSTGDNNSSGENNSSRENKSKFILGIIIFLLLIFLICCFGLIYVYSG